MLKFAANLDWLYADQPIEQRFANAQANGFQGVEGLFLWQHPLESLLAAQRETALPVVLMNAPAGDWAAGERGVAALPGRGPEFRQGLEWVCGYGYTLGCAQIHVMAGKRVAGMDAGEQYALLIRRLQYACDYAEQYGITVLLEPLNPEDMPDYFIDNFPLAEKIIRDVRRENIGLQFDIYHCQKIHGNIMNNILRYRSVIRHFQIASVPGRNEPGSGELNDVNILACIASMPFQGWIGCEYKPSEITSNKLTWLTSYL
ncbi:hydroxypyruvate isomerase family protein [Enterobacillus tribolii]|uniref:Hydroxypyruvate isomerase n=1 Tax=Enterobacillus tribolii TaxID=1487935 RepID=A0A370QNN0_9GAMM|nr:TIM barrel protein [Enterobacillus tribolii]MBW7982002.1 hydroxypyruvate isomerase [Enterobacillus tribolii]RDK89979.1 hydroxypyruvate isomerase [Enterobacillus tribolii]